MSNIYITHDKQPNDEMLMLKKATAYPVMY